MSTNQTGDVIKLSDIPDRERDNCVTTTSLLMEDGLCNAPGVLTYTGKALADGSLFISGNELGKFTLSNTNFGPNEQTLQCELQFVLDRAKAAGYVVEIQTIPLEPLAMGHFEQRPVVRKARGHY